MAMHSRWIPTALVLLSAACGLERSTQPDADLRTLGTPVSDPTPGTISLQSIGSYAGGALGAAEITAYDEVSRRLFVVNGALGTVDVLDLRDPTAPRRVGGIAVTHFGAGANSVATHRGIVALAIEAHTRTDPGVVAFYRASTLDLISSVSVGALPDMVTFTPSGRHVLVANEGEPNADYTVDPEGSVSVIDVHNITRPTVRTAGFARYNGQADQLRASGVRIFGPHASVAQDLEPEYIAVSEDGRTAWVTLQENNAFAVIDVAAAQVTAIVPLGYKDHSLPGNELDASDRDGPGNGPLVNIRSWPVRGLYLPDGIASYTAHGQTFLVTANEGDAREYLGAPGFVEESRVNALTLNPAIFTAAVCGGTCGSNSRLGRLTVTTTLGRNANGQYDALYAFGARSFSIWNAAGQLIWDSGSQLERLTTSLPMVNFNASNTGNALDDRSDNKGPEPEGVAIGRLGSRTFAFIGLERVGGIMVFDISVPTMPFFVTYASDRAGSGGDRGPEGLTFIPARQSPNRRPLLIVGNEISGTTRIYEVKLH